MNHMKKVKLFRFSFLSKYYINCTSLFTSKLAKETKIATKNIITKLEKNYQTLIMMIAQCRITIKKRQISGRSGCTLQKNYDNKKLNCNNIRTIKLPRFTKGTSRIIIFIINRLQLKHSNTNLIPTN